MRRKITHILWGLTGTFIVCVTLFFVAIWNGWIGYVPPIEELENPINRYASQILSDDGELLGTWSYSENRIYASYDEIAPCVFKALIATEDKRFYEHSGIDLRSLFRAIVKRGIMRQSAAGGGVSSRAAGRCVVVVGPERRTLLPSHQNVWTVR